MTWGDYMLPLGVVVSVAAMVGFVVLASRAVYLPEISLLLIPLVGIAVCQMISSLSRFDSTLIARKRQEEIDRQQEKAARERERAIKQKAEELFIEHLKTTGMYDIWRFNKCGDVPERFEKEAAAYVQNP